MLALELRELFPKGTIAALQDFKLVLDLSAQPLEFRFLSSDQSAFTGHGHFHVAHLLLERFLVFAELSAVFFHPATFLSQLGYTTERLQTGRELLRRVAHAADYDLVVIDRHIGDPVLADLLAMGKQDANIARRPVLVVASPDAPRPVPLVASGLMVVVRSATPSR